MRFAEPVKILFLPEMGLLGSQASTKTNEGAAELFFPIWLGLGW